MLFYALNVVYITDVTRIINNGPWRGTRKLSLPRAGPTIFPVDGVALGPVVVAVGFSLPSTDHFLLLFMVTLWAARAH